ncbi:MAG: hypothetical protein A2V77_12355 [Anaeromyxobacter sp. RBG_16_69_14]|nr:MAG: hypothetical protein A2V77_12355 [Anaeromyxobacter sp. RBG_16_69_14]
MSSPRGKGLEAGTFQRREPAGWVRIRASLAGRRPREAPAPAKKGKLAALDLLLDLSVAALHAVHPDLGVDEPEPHRSTVLAGSIIEAAHRLRGLLKGYRAALARHYRDIPF